MCREALQIHPCGCVDGFLERCHVCLVTGMACREPYDRTYVQRMWDFRCDEHYEADEVELWSARLACKDFFEWVRRVLMGMVHW